MTWRWRAAPAYRLRRLVTARIRGRASRRKSRSPRVASFRELARWIRKTPDLRWVQKCWRAARASASPWSVTAGWSPPSSSAYDVDRACLCQPLRPRAHRTDWIEGEFFDLTGLYSDLLDPRRHLLARKAGAAWRARRSGGRLVRLPVEESDGKVSGHRSKRRVSMSPKQVAVKIGSAASWSAWSRSVLDEQRRARRWGIFFKSLTFLYLFVVLLLALGAGSGGKDKALSGRHTALVARLNGSHRRR